MRIVEMVTERGRSVSGRSENKRRSVNYEFKPVEGLKYCKRCGTEFEIGIEECDVCKGNNFLDGDIAERIAGYILLSNRHALKLYAKNVKKIETGFKGNKKISKMTNKQVAFLLLVEDGFFNVDDDESFKMIEKIFWYRYSRR